MLSRAPGPPCWTLLLNLLLVSSSGDQQSKEEVIKAHPGDDVTLPCRAPEEAPIIAAEWSKPEMQTNYVFFYRDGQVDIARQHPFYQNRVEPVDSKLKDGDLSIVLKNVVFDDSGRYECRVKQGVTKRSTRAVIRSEPISIVNVTVSGVRGAAGLGPIGAGGRLVGHVGLMVGLVVMVFI